MATLTSDNPTTKIKRAVFQFRRAACSICIGVYYKMSEAEVLPKISIKAISCFSELPPHALYYGSIHCHLRAVRSKCNPYENYYHCDLYDTSNIKMLLFLNMTQKVWSALSSKCQTLLKHSAGVIHIALIGVTAQYTRHDVPVIILKEANKMVGTT